MRKECLTSLTALLAAAGLGLAQPAAAPPVLASPAPRVGTGAARMVMPSELPPVTDATADPGLFPLPGAGLVSEPTWVGDAGQGGASPAPRFHVWASGEPLLWFVSPDGGFHYGQVTGGRAAAGIVKPSGELGLELDGLLLGRATARAGAARSSSQLWGAEANVVSGACASPRFGLDVLGGFRYLALDEDAGAPTDADSLRTRNQFFGGQLGSQMEVRWGRLYTNLLGKVAVGNVHQEVRQARDDFGVVPEVNVNLGYQLRPGVRLYAGYSFLYLSDVARPGDQAVGTPQVPPSQFPGNPLFNRSDFWAQGLNFGLAVRY